MSLKTPPSENHKSVKFDEYKLLDNQISRLAEIMHRVNTRSWGRQNNKIDLLSLTFINAESEDAENILTIAEAMIEAEVISGRGVMIEREEDTLLSDTNPEIITIHEGHTEDKTTLE